MISSRYIAKAVTSFVNKGKHKPEEVAEKLMTFVKKYHLESQLPQVISHIKDESEKEKRGQTLLIETPHKIDEATSSAVTAFMSVPQNVPVRHKTNEALIGGFVAYWKDKKVDGSIHNTLKKLKETLLA